METTIQSFEVKSYNSHPIYSVNCIFVDETFFGAKRTANWGFLYNKEEAIESVKTNATDMFECGYYNYAFIEEIPEGICSIPTSRMFFKAYFDEKYNFVRAEQIVSLETMPKYIQPLWVI